MSEIILGQPFYVNDNNTSRRAVFSFILYEDGKIVFSEYQKYIFWDLATFNAYLVSELIGHDSPVANHVSCDPGALVSTIYARLNNVLEPVVKMVQNITNTLNFVPEKKKIESEIITFLEFIEYFGWDLTFQICR